MRSNRLNGKVYVYRNSLTTVNPRIEKLKFSLGIGTIVLTEYVILGYPTRFPCLYVCMTAILLLTRYFRYSRIHFQFLLFDYCYAVNLSCVLQVLLGPENQTWLLCNFFSAVGPVACSVITWQNELAPTSINKMSTSVMHIYPAILCHIIRWNFMSSSLRVADLSFIDLLLPYYSFYLAWQAAYLIITEIICKDYLDANPQLTTSLRSMRRDQNSVANKATTGFFRMVGYFRPDQTFNESTSHSLLLFAVAQAVFTTLSLIPVLIVLNSSNLSILWITAIFTVAVWNGGALYAPKSCL